MKITENWLKRAGKPCGPRGFAWTRAQFEALGIKYPPRHGWIDRIVGTEISEDAARAFVEGKNIVSKYTLKMRAKRARRKAQEMAKPATERSESIADMLVMAQIKGSMGESIDDWEADMLPPWDS